MTSFEFIFGLISVITSLALTRMLSGCATLFRHSERIRFSWRHGLWTATAFMVLVGNWAAFWGKRNAQGWSPLDVLVPLIFTGILYAFCDLVMPDMSADGRPMDLREYHAREGKRYKLLQLMFAVVAMLMMARMAANIGQWFDMSRFAILAALLGAVALRARSAWLDTATAACMTMLGVAFMVSSLRIFAT